MTICRSSPRLINKRRPVGGTMSTPDRSREARRLILGGATHAAVCAQFNISDRTLRDWVRRANEAERDEKSRALISK